MVHDRPASGLLQPYPSLIPGPPRSTLHGPAPRRLLYNCCITTKEMTAALVAFKLMGGRPPRRLPAASQSCAAVSCGIQLLYSCGRSLREARAYRSQLSAPAKMAAHHASPALHCAAWSYDLPANTRRPRGTAPTTLHRPPPCPTRAACPHPPPIHRPRQRWLHPCGGPGAHREHRAQVCGGHAGGCRWVERGVRRCGNPV